MVDSYSMRRMIMSHQTAVLDSQPIDTLTATDAIDRYLDEARVRLAGIAAKSVEAAQAMDLLAAIYLGRADARTLPSSTALCLRRAALQGQPANASLAMRLGMHLADLGLYQEARWRWNTRSNYSRPMKRPRRSYRYCGGPATTMLPRT